MSLIRRIFRSASRDRLVAADKALQEACEKAKTTAKPKARVLATTSAAVLALLAISACAAPQAEQGRASQGGSTGQQPVVNVNVVFHGDVKADALANGTAAPSAASEAAAEQRADNEVPVVVDAGGVVPAGRVAVDAAAELVKKREAQAAAAKAAADAAAEIAKKAKEAAEAGKTETVPAGEPK